MLGLNEIARLQGLASAEDAAFAARSLLDVFSNAAEPRLGSTNVCKVLAHTLFK